MHAVDRQTPDDIAYPSSFAFVLVHPGCVAVPWTGPSWRAPAFGVAMYVL